MTSISTEKTQLSTAQSIKALAHLQARVDEKTIREIFRCGEKLGLYYWRAFIHNHRNFPYHTFSHVEYVMLAEAIEKEHERIKDNL